MSCDRSLSLIRSSCSSEYAQPYSLLLQDTTTAIIVTHVGECQRGINPSGELGHNLMDHVKGGSATAIIPGNENHVVIGRRPNGIYVPRFRNVKTNQKEFLRG